MTQSAAFGAPAAGAPGFRVIRVGGTPYQMGSQHGEELRDGIRDLIAAIHHHILHGQPGLTGWGIRRAVPPVVHLMASQIPHRYREEIRGMARAAGVAYGDLLMVNCFDDLLANLRMLAAMFGRLGCSVFALSGTRTASGELVAGRNLDYFVMSAYQDDAWAATTYMKEHVVVVNYAPTDRHGFVSVGWPGFAGVATGMSARGLVAAATVVQTVRNWPLGTPACFLYRRVMEEACSLEEAVGIITGAHRTQGHNVLLAAGAEDRAVVVEYTPWRAAVREPADGWIATTNHFNHPEMTRHHARLAFLSSTERFARLRELCGSNEKMGADPRAFLLDRTRRSSEANEYCTLWNPCTIYSTYFEPVRGQLWVRVADREERQFVPVPLDGVAPLPWAQRELVGLDGRRTLDKGEGT